MAAGPLPPLHMKINKTGYLILLLLLIVHCSYALVPIRVTCVGNSITFGYGLSEREKEAYPQRLQTLLGRNWEVHNFGVSGATLLSRGNQPYVQTAAYLNALDSKPDIVMIKLGTNDSKLINRKNLADFKKDYKELIFSFRRLPTHPRIILLLPLPCFGLDSSSIYDPVITSRIIPLIREVAFEEATEVIDLHSLLIDHADYFPDRLHPDSRGHELIARRLLNLLTAKRDTSFDIKTKLPETTSEINFYGYREYDFQIDERACKVVAPKWSASGHPWIWRARFWGHEPQADIALLEHGFHLVYIDAAELYGNHEAIRLWDEFYQLLHRGGLHKKAALEGMSRGGVYAYNWAAENPAKVACVYADNPVLDLKSWPGGKGEGPGSPGDWALFKQDYGFTTDSAAMTFHGSPLDRVQEIVRGKYPMLHLLADADEVVPPTENTLPFEQAIIAGGGKITVFHKPGFKHHPHSLPNPSVIVDFITQAYGTL